MEKPHKKRTGQTPALANIPAFMMDRMGFLLNRSAQRIREMVEEGLRPFGLTGKHLGILAIIQEDGALPQQEIGKCMYVDRSTMVQLIDDLEKSKLVERKDNPEDRRAHSLVLTAKGRETLPKALQLALQAEKEFLQGLVPKDQKELMRILKQLVLHHYSSKTKTV